ncbi:MAG: NAD(P)H-dependent oxidoreductase subunit E [Deltaproteobacteria bacterium]|nr:NAD(P)H-dependent oxidoreductase subunit E [Deltaproteobacteria bacterium]
MKLPRKNKVKQIFEKHNQGQGTLISLLQDIQSEFGYLPKEVLLHAAEELEVPLSKIFAVASFYHSFSLKPQGKSTVSVCTGTACHVKNADNLAQSVSRELGLESGEGTSPDGEFTLKKVRCLGCCSMAPVVKINDDIHGGMTQVKTGNLLQQYRKDNK